MDALTLLRDQSKWTNDILSQVVADLTDGQATWRAPGSTIQPIAPIFLHVYHNEDRAVHRGLGRPTVFESQGWAEKLGYRPDEPWLPLGKVDAAALRAYAAAVHAATTDYLDRLQPDDLTRVVESHRGPRSVAALLSLLLVTHKASHMGEIAALLGSQGVKGFPF